MRNLPVTVFLGSLLVVCTIPTAQGTEKKIRRSDLPAAVQKTVDTEARGATIREFSRETEKGNTFYEVSLLLNGHGKDVLIDPTGKVVEVEEQVSLDSLPGAVREALQSGMGNGRIVQVESLTKSGKLVAYEAQIRTGNKTSEVQVGPDGQPLDHEE